MCKLNPPPETEITRKFVCQNIHAHSTPSSKMFKTFFSKSGKPLTCKQHCQYTTKLNTAKTRGTASKKPRRSSPLTATHRKPQTQQTAKKQLELRKLFLEPQGLKSQHVVHMLKCHMVFMCMNWQLLKVTDFSDLCVSSWCRWPCIHP